MLKFRRAAQIVMYLAVTLAAIATGYNQLGNALVTYGELNTRQASEACAALDMPHAVLVDGVTNCYTIYMGTEYLMPLEKLQELKAKYAE